MSVVQGLTGLVVGVLFGYVLQRGQLCFHAMWSGLYDRRTLLARGWLLAVAIASVGLAVLYLLPFASGLNTGLAFQPVANVAGGLVLGIGMVVASSCASALFYKLGSGMLGALVGIAGWALGEYTVSRFSRPGPTVLPFGDGGTIPGVLGLPRLAVAVPFLVVVVVVFALRRHRVVADPDTPSWQWGWVRSGIGLGAVTIIGWISVGLVGVSFGPSTVGAVAGFADGSPMWWLTGFLLGMVGGGNVAARIGGGLWVRGERPIRYPQLLVGGFLVGGGGWLGAGCNLGHGLSGVAQLNVSSWVVVVAIVAGIGLARLVRTLAMRALPDRSGSGGARSSGVGRPVPSR